MSRRATTRQVSTLAVRAVRVGLQQTYSDHDSTHAQLVADAPTGLHEGGADVHRDACEELPLGRDSKGSHGVRERHDEAAVHGLEVS